MQDSIARARLGAPGCTQYALIAQWIELLRPKERMSVRFWLRAQKTRFSAGFGLFSNPEKLGELRFIEAYKDVVANNDNRYTHLRGDIEHLLAFLNILGDIDAPPQGS